MTVENAIWHLDKYTFRIDKDCAQKADLLDSILYFVDVHSVPNVEWVANEQKYYARQDVSQRRTDEPTKTCGKILIKLLRQARDRTQDKGSRSSYHGRKASFLKESIRRESRQECDYPCQANCDDKKCSYEVDAHEDVIQATNGAIKILHRMLNR